MCGIAHIFLHDHSEEPNPRTWIWQGTYWSELDIDGLIAGQGLLHGHELLHVAAVPSLHHFIHVEGARQLRVTHDDNG